MAAWRYEMFLLLLKNISRVSAANEWNIFQHSKRNFVSPRGHVVSSIYFMARACKDITHAVISLRASKAGEKNILLAGLVGSPWRLYYSRNTSNKWACSQATRWLANIQGWIFLKWVIVNLNLAGKLQACRVANYKPNNSHITNCLLTLTSSGPYWEKITLGRYSPRMTVVLG